MTLNLSTPTTNNNQQSVFTPINDLISTLLTNHHPTLNHHNDLQNIYIQLLLFIERIHPHLSVDPSSTQKPTTPPPPPPNPISSISTTPIMAQPTTKDAVPILLKAIHSQSQALGKCRLDLQFERGHVKMLRDENTKLKQNLVHFALITEQEEEAITNKFLVKIEELNKEKAKIIEQVEHEEEFITNQLQRKLAKLQREKIDMENQLEQEQEAIVNRLQKQLEIVRSSSVSSCLLDSNFNTSPSLDPSTPLRRRTSSQTSFSDSHLSTLPPTPLMDIMRADLIGLKHRLRELELENGCRTEQLRKWRDELLTFRQRSGVPVDDLFAVSLEPTSAERRG